MLVSFPDAAVGCVVGPLGIVATVLGFVIGVVAEEEPTSASLGVSVPACAGQHCEDDAEL